MDLYDHDESLSKGGFSVIAGVDEAGRGPLAGPVVAAAVILPRGIRIEGIRDSKKVPEDEREYLFKEIVRNAVAVGIGRVDSGEIDRINVLRATKQAMHQAVMGLRVAPDLVLIDALQLPSLSVKQVSIIKGDAQSAAIAAASIIAKVVRDRVMVGYHRLYPLYGFDRHKGYATKVHLDRLRQHGPSPLHRRSFEGVMSLELPFGGG